MLSIVIPVFNEEDNVLPLHERVTAAMQGVGVDYEVIVKLRLGSSPWLRRMLDSKS
jgi:hypothetical protein